MSEHLVDRLVSLPKLAGIPREELVWLVDHGRFDVYEVGTVIGPKGKPIKKLWILLSGKVVIHVDRGAGPKLVTEWQTGDVTGMLPYSRMTGPPGDTYIEEKVEALDIEVKIFPEMIHHCPSFTAHTVHIMLDRARNFNTSDLQDEKMISLGKLSAGLAHELNNPASATVRDAKMLLKGLGSLDAASRAFGAANLTDDQIKKIEDMRVVCLDQSDRSLLSSIQKADHQDKISDWLIARRLDPDLAVTLADTFITIKQLDELASVIPAEALEISLKWIINRYTMHILAVEIEQATTQVHKVVNAVKKFTYMDNLAGKEFTDVESGIQDTLSVLIAKSKSKNANITLDIPENIPRVYGNGSDLNQVWFGVIDNALDAIPRNGNICIEARSVFKKVVVRIIDDGPGIPPDTVSRIFDPFFTTKSPGQGTGLGLDIARRLLQRYHGDISVQSRPGRTEFCVGLAVEKTN